MNFRVGVTVPVVACRFCLKSFNKYHGLGKLFQFDVFEEFVTVLPGKWIRTEIRLFGSVAITARLATESDAADGDIEFNLDEP